MQESRIDAVRERALQLIEFNRIAGMDTRHNRATNLLAIKELTEGHPHYTFGIKGVERYTQEEVLQAIADITKCSKDPNVKTGGGYISPLSTLAGLEEMARAIYPLAKQGGHFYLGTGHPGALLLYYIELGKAIRNWGGHLVQAERGAFIAPNFDLDYVEGIAVLSDRCSLFHSHDPKPMEMVIATGKRIDMVISDHGFAAGAVNAGIPTVAIIDTNDPALAVAKRMGANIIIVPMDDNRPMYNYLPVVEIVNDLVSLQNESNVDLSRSVADGNSAGHLTIEPDPRPEVEARFGKAWDIVKQKLGNVQAMDAAIEDILEPYVAQFLERNFDLERDEDLIDNPFVTLAIYKAYHDALNRYIRDQIAHRQVDLTEEEIEYYFGINRP